MKSELENLECYKCACDFCRLISNAVKTYFPEDEKYRLTDQIIRASRSTPANIAESYGRFHFKDIAKFLLNARGSAYEVIDHLQVALEEKYISEDSFFLLKNKCINLIKIINGYYRYVKGRQ